MGVGPHIRWFLSLIINMFGAASVAKIENSYEFETKNDLSG